MSLMQYLYGRLLDQMLDKLSDTKMVKAPWLVDNYSFKGFSGSHVCSKHVSYSRWYRT